MEKVGVRIPVAWTAGLLDDVHADPDEDEALSLSWHVGTRRIRAFTTNSSLYVHYGFFYYAVDDVGMHWGHSAYKWSNHCE